MIDINTLDCHDHHYETHLPMNSVTSCKGINGLLHDRQLFFNVFLKKKSCHIDLIARIIGFNHGRSVKNC